MAKHVLIGLAVALAVSVGGNVTLAGLHAASQSEVTNLTTALAKAETQAEAAREDVTTAQRALADSEKELDDQRATAAKEQAALYAAKVETLESELETADAHESAGPSHVVEDHAATADTGLNLFLELVEQACDLQTSGIPDPAGATVEPAADGIARVTDADGAVMLLNMNARIVTSVDGAEGVLPLNYSFGCNPSMFVGMSHD